MVNSLVVFLDKYATGKNILIGVALIAFTLIIAFPYFSILFFGVDVPTDIILDVKPYYTVEMVYTLLEKLGDLGRKSYLYSTIIVDMPYAFIYTITYALFVFYLLKKNSLYKFYALVFLPIAIGIFDLLENASIVIYLVKHPVQLTSFIPIASLFTTLKWTFALLTFLTILGLSIRLLFIKIKMIRN